MGKSGRTLLVALLALLVSPDVLGFSLIPAGARHRSQQHQLAARGKRSIVVRPLSMQADPRFDSLVERVETASKAPKEAAASAAVPAFKSQAGADAPATIAEVQEQISTATTKVVAEQQPPSVTAAGSGQAFDGAVSVGSVGLQVFEGLAVVAAVPAILAAINKQQAAQQLKERNKMRAEELARGRQARADAKAAALAQAAIDRKKKQEGIAERIEAARIEEERQESVRQMVMEAQVKKQADEAVAAKIAAEEAAAEKAASDARREASRLEREAKLAAKQEAEEKAAAEAARLKAKQEAEAKAAAEAAELKAKQEAEFKAKQEAEAKAAAEAAELKAKQEAEAKAAAEAAELKAKQEAEAKAAAEVAELKAKEEAEAKAAAEAAELKAKQETEVKAAAEAAALKARQEAAELKAKQEPEAKAKKDERQTAGLTARKLREQANARLAAEAEAKAADSAPKSASWTTTIPAPTTSSSPATPVSGGGSTRRSEKSRRLAPALAQARKNNAAKIEVLAILNKMDADTLASFGKEVGVEEGPAGFDALRTTIVKKLEARGGTWSEIAPEVAEIASKFATPA